MTKKEFYLQMVISLASNPQFAYTNKEDEEQDFPYLEFTGICQNASSLADWLEDMEGFVFDEEDD